MQPQSQRQPKSGWLNTYGPAIVGIGLPLGYLGARVIGSRAARNAAKQVEENLRAGRYGTGHAPGSVADTYAAAEAARAAREAQRVPNAFKLYGIDPKGPAPTAEQLKKMYRSKSMDVHPDRGGTSEAFQQAQEGYDLLKGHYKYSSFVEMLSFLETVMKRG